MKAACLVERTVASTAACLVERKDAKMVRLTVDMKAENWAKVWAGKRGDSMVAYLAKKKARMTGRTKVDKRAVALVEQKGQWRVATRVASMDDQTESWKAE